MRVMEYVNDAPGWLGVWPEPGDRGVVLVEAAVASLVCWRLRANGRERSVWTRHEYMREVQS